MKLFFWQNTNSIHQSSFLRCLDEMNTGNVTLLTTNRISSHRSEMGWAEPKLGNVTHISLWNDTLQISDIIDDNSGSDSVHIFSGINAFPVIQKAFLYAIKKGCRIGIFTEPLDFRGVKGKFRTIRGFYHRYLYSSNIEFVLATGKNGVDQFKLWGYDSRKVFEWAYTVENSNCDIIGDISPLSGEYMIAFAGSLIPRKGYDILIKALEKIDLPFKADLYCLRPDQINSSKSAETVNQVSGSINFHNFLPNATLRRKLNTYDLFILPSRHDGWGAVVSESIMEGTPVLVSKYCGSSSLITDNQIGKVINSLDVEKLAQSIRVMIEKGKVRVTERRANRAWAISHISGKPMASYFLKIIDFLDKGLMVDKPTAPWYQIEKQ
ncbi:hypothetical protein DSL64_02760 [Dyadobacter luteus]|uniref:Glycosyl transferase family 1 domain-containing protein n=1 Tax=Dyadobacter luteus TaxID=2259619 RepID=A0A3D8YIJ2_9BACT|nr:glycosyltransferase [Dyadobacter luteus]REA64487.1 hypothetical protein DSL64_02760 [Dyadobacter luteus]